MSMDADGAHAATINSDWWVPFDSITLKDQIGAGAAGQVGDVDRVGRIFLPVGELGVTQVHRPREALATRVVAQFPWR